MKDDCLLVFDTLLSGTNSVFPLESLKKKILSKKKLVIKLGADPTAPNLHLGHLVVLEKLRDFQELGHQIIFLIGDFTARIGDPTGKSKTRPALSEEEIATNVMTYREQISRVLDMNAVKVVYNSLWYDTFTSRDWLKLCGSVTLAQIIERDDFKNRIESHTPIGLHEILYPLLQGYDSVMLEADIEIGGTDQTFNLCIGRTLQEHNGMEGQVVMTMPLIEGTDGINKMSKSLKNEIGLMDHPNEVFGKIMSLSDDLMWKYYLVLLRYSSDQIASIKEQFLEIENKKNLAFKILEKYWSYEEAAKAKEYFVSVIQNKSYDEQDIKKIIVTENVSYTIFDLFFLIDKTVSRSEIRRLIQSGAVVMNGIKIDSDKYIFKKSIENKDILRIGKHKIFCLYMA